METWLTGRGALAAHPRDGCRMPYAAMETWLTERRAPSAIRPAPDDVRPRIAEGLEGDIVEGKEEEEEVIIVAREEEEELLNPCKLY